MTTLRAGLIGFPLKHSRAPRLYQHWIKQHGIDGSYEIVEVSVREFESRLRQLVSDGWRGGSITMPHKETALALADEVSERATAIGSANTLVFESGKIIADNTDGIGFMKNLMHTAGNQFNPAKPALIFGAGGACRAVLHSLLDSGVPEVRIANRTRERAQSLADRFGQKVRVIDWAKSESAMPGVGIIVNTTSMGMSTNPSLPFKLDLADDNAVVADIVARPTQNSFLDSAQTRNLSTVSGLGMLLHQAPPGFEAWYGVAPTVDDVVRDVMLAD